MIEKIDLNKIRGRWTEYSDEKGGAYNSGGDDTIASIKLVAEKINEIIDLLPTNNKEE